MNTRWIWFKFEAKNWLTNFIAKILGYKPCSEKYGYPIKDINIPEEGEICSLAISPFHFEKAVLKKRTDDSYLKYYFEFLDGSFMNLHDLPIKRLCKKHFDYTEKHG